MDSMTYAARILGVFPITSSSHQIVYRAVMKELALRGHELVVITPYPMRDPSIKNYTEIDVSFMNKAWQSQFNFVEGRRGKITAHGMMVKQQDFGGLLCELMLSHPQVKELISSQENDQHFDLMFLEMVLTPGIFGFIHRFPVPSIGITSFEAFSINYDSVGNPNLPAYAPDVFLPYSDRKTFFERVHCLLFLLWLKYHFYYTVIPTQDAIARRHFGEAMPYLGDLHFKPSMLFVTTDFIFHSPRPNVPAVVHITPYPMRDPSIKNYTEIDVSFMNKAWQSQFNFVEGRRGKITAHGMMVKQQDFGGLLCELMLSHPQVKELISSQENDQHFDLMFLEMVLTPGIFGFIHRFPVPSIGITSFEAFSINYDSVGNPNLPAYAPDVFLPYSDRKTFFERVHCLLFLLWLKYHFYYTVIPTQDAIARRHFGEAMPYLGDLHFKPSMLFVTTDFIFHSPRPNVPAVVQLSGLHINSPKPLPQDIKEFMDSAPKGVIYFSLGSNVRSDTMDAQKRQIFLDVFSELPGYHVLWKWESDSLPGQPKNVKLAKWMPQQDVLRKY
uniref:UDP-glycosyltransferase n=1 Tax=Timema cristinae TaxID=61476 RepID=A0A7R9DEE4_TIMCR|nr:unnamed protein product [Timema cristinae]